MVTQLVQITMKAEDARPPSASTWSPRRTQIAKNRVYLDLATTSAGDRAELVARLGELGATTADVGQGDVPWTVLADPEGNEFCLTPPA